MPPITDVIKHIIIINILVFVVVNIMFAGNYELERYFVLFNFDDPRFSPVQFITSMFNHANFQHLLFNMLGLYFLGPMVEMALGQKKFFTLYMAAGLGASIAHLLLVHSSGGLLGASGAVFGVTAAFATMFPNVELMLMFIPVPVKAKYLVVGILVFGFIAAALGYLTNVAHLAHAAGAVIGFVLILVWKKNNLR
jgi:membrane associated rhomboid family serine protease